jgi:hypothetical protein
MFTEPTVLVLGAGASWHYGYPTGEELIADMASEADTLFGDVQVLERAGPAYVLEYIRDEAKLKTEDTCSINIQPLWNDLKEKCSSLMKRLRVINPLVIDYFLGQNEDLRSIGRLLIGAALISRESHGRPKHARPLEKHDWYRFIFYKLCEDCLCSADIRRNDLRIITFNYDISIDKYLSEALSNTALFESDDIETFLSDRIVHVYGRIKPPSMRQQTELMRGRLRKHHELYAQATSALDKWDKIYQRSRSLRVIDPHEKPDNQRELDLARRSIARAEHVYILGYGFDHNNNERIGLNVLMRRPIPTLATVPRHCRVHFTNYGDSARINKRAGKLLADDPSVFLKPGHCIETATFRYVEKSVKSVYDALSLDFDL